MIKKAFFLLLSIFLTGVVSSQSKFNPEWNIGVGFGPTFSTVSFDPGINTKNLNQFHGGIAVKYISEKHLGLIGELNYSQQGWEGSFKENPDFKHVHSLTYFEVPVMTHIYFGRKVRFFVNLGPKIQFLASEKEEISDALANYISNRTEVIFAGSALQRTGQYNKNARYKLDYGLIGGIGLEVRTKIGHFDLEGRYYAGFGDLFDNHASDFNFNRSANRVISAKLTYYTKLF